MTEENGEKIEFEIKGKIELPKFDIMEYVGKNATIEYYEKRKGQYGYFVILYSSTLGEYEYEGETKAVRASKMLGLQTDAEGCIGWGENTKTGKFLSYMKADSIEELVGKPIKIMATEPNKEMKRYLTF